MSDEPFNLNSWMSQIGDPLPEDWRISVSIYNQGAEIELVDPDGDVVEFTEDDLTVDEMLQIRVNHARQQDGLGQHFDLPPYCHGLAVSPEITSLRAQLAAEKAMRHDAMTAYAKLDADWRVEKALREAAEARAVGLRADVESLQHNRSMDAFTDGYNLAVEAVLSRIDDLTSGDAAKREET
jgi:hypothetical protein